DLDAVGAGQGLEQPCGRLGLVVGQRGRCQRRAAVHRRLDVVRWGGRGGHRRWQAFLPCRRFGSIYVDLDGYDGRIPNLVRLAAPRGLVARSARSGTACRRLIAGTDPAPSTPARPPRQGGQGGPAMPDGQLDPISRATFAHSIESLHEEFRGTYSLETVERFVDESIDRLAGARVVDFIPLFVHRFARERLRALAQAQGAIMSDVPEVLFVCVHNAGRSQMAAALPDR